MLLSLAVRNLVLIDKLDLDFNQGLSVLTGETGAGKSILLDALGLVLGDRAETSLIRHGEDKLTVSAIFKVNNAHPVYAVLDEYEVDTDGDEISIKRTLDKEGKGKIFVNDQPVTAKLLKEIGKLLVEVHGQFDNHGLLNPANHLGVLDAYGNYPELLDAAKTDYQNYKISRTKRIEASAILEKAKKDEENLRHWINELEKLKLVQNEEEVLAKKRLELMNAEKLIEGLNYAYNALTQGTDTPSAIRQAAAAISKANQFVEGKYDDIIEMLDQALILVSEAANSIEGSAETISSDRNELENIEGRLFALKAMARKHNTTVAMLSDTLANFRNQLSTIELGEENINSLRKEEEKNKLEFLKTAKELSKKRIEAAKNLDKNVMLELAPLKMEKAKFITIIEEVDENSWSASGIDNVYFTVSTNPNSPQGPINKIASGGELARFMLALKLNLAQSSSVKTMIFDEIDTGIGGATAQAVGDRLARLAKDVQILVVTHSPQVAAKGDNHFKVEKFTKNNITTTKVVELDKKEKQEEIARMLSGEQISEEARAAANVLIG
ncbi:MAG: DNA repair protein RecN [Lactobacillaceae bacterium]|jgi:DNA repair protein RecN (Recombination protein N)|nr:DNA repair protein RecN [Lactobacillaceae bacterium]